MSEEKNMLTTAEVAKALNVGREAARLIMKTARGVVTLPPLTGKGKRFTRRMPLAVLQALLARRAASNT